MKNSFLRGVSKGYVEKIESQKKMSAQSFELAIIEKNLAHQLKTVYSRIGHSSMGAGLIITARMRQELSPGEI